MSKRNFQNLPPENQRVLRAYADAKREFPSLTQGEFMAAWHKSKRTGKSINAEIGSEQYNKKVLASEARYFRLIREGKRKPTKLLAEADRWNGRVTVTIGRGANRKSFDMRLRRGISKLDLFKVKDNAKFKRTARKHAKAFDQRYGMSLSDDIDETLEIRPVQNFGPKAKVEEFIEKID